MRVNFIWGIYARELGHTIASNRGYRGYRMNYRACWELGIWPFSHIPIDCCEKTHSSLKAAMRCLERLSSGKSMGLKICKRVGRGKQAEWVPAFR